MTLQPGYAPSEQHLCYTLRRGRSRTVAIYTMPGDVHVFLRLRATFYLSAIAIYRMPHLPHLCLTLRFCHMLQYSIRFRYIACRCICFAIIIFYMSEIYSPLFTLFSPIPSVLHICVDPSSGCNAYSSSSASASSPPSPLNPSTSLVPRSHLVLATVLG